MVLHHEAQVAGGDAHQQLLRLQDERGDQGVVLAAIVDGAARCAEFRERTHVERDVLALQGLQRARVDHAGAEVAELDRLAVADVAEQPRVREPLRVRVEHAGHVLPDGHAFSVQQVGEDGRAEVGAFAPERGGIAFRRGADEALHDHRILHLPLVRPPLEGVVHHGLAGLPVHPGGAVGGIGHHQVAGVHPGALAQLLAQVGAHDHGAPQLAVGHHPVVVAVGIAGGAFPKHLLQLRETAQQPGLGLVEARDHLAQHHRKAVAQGRDMGRRIASREPGGVDLLQRVGGLAHGAHHHEQLIVREVPEHLRHVAHAFRVLYAGSSELEHFHAEAICCNCSWYSRPFTHSPSSSAPRRL